jgi:hypothetical protein
VPGFALAAADSLVWGAEMAPIKKLGDGRSTGLGWRPLVGGAWERRRDREERVREDIYPSFRGVKCSEEKLKIERATEP